MKQVKVKVEGKAGQFPCGCGRAYSTAAKFSDHVHRDHAEDIGWGAAPTKDE